MVRNALDLEHGHSGLILEAMPYAWICTRVSKRLCVGGVVMELSERGFALPHVCSEC